MDDSWWLKVKRAQKHMVDIDREAVRCASGHPYEFTRVRLPDSQGKVTYSVRITEQPDPMIAVMLGDFVHNLRCALDYIVVGCVPRQRQKSASFQILYEDIWAKNEEGKFMVNDSKRRDDFETATKGLHADARALLIREQPYHQGPDAYRAILGVISRLENLDEHRRLTIVGGGLQNVVGTFSVRGRPAPMELRAFGKFTFAKHGTQIGYTFPAKWPLLDGTVIQPSEVDMEFTGTAKILVEVSRVGGNKPDANFPLRFSMLAAMGDVRRFLRLMEPFVRRQPLIQ